MSYSPKREQALTVAMVIERLTALPLNAPVSITNEDDGCWDYATDIVVLDDGSVVIESKRQP